MQLTMHSLEPKWIRRVRHYHLGDKNDVRAFYAFEGRPPRIKGEPRSQVSQESCGRGLSFASRKMLIS